MGSRKVHLKYQMREILGVRSKPERVFGDKHPNGKTTKNLPHLKYQMREIFESVLNQNAYLEINIQMGRLRKSLYFLKPV